MTSLIGRQIGNLTILGTSRIERRATDATRTKPHLRYFYRARCSCGAEIEVRDTQLYGKKAKKSCQACSAHHCISPYTEAERAIRSVWEGMMGRCYRPQDHNFKNYGARGIRVDQPWRTFANFARDMAPRPPGGTLERNNNDGPYSKANCHWATPEQQAHNKRTSGRFEHEGQALTLAEWAGLTGKDPDHFRIAMGLGIPFHEILRYCYRHS